MPRKKTNHSYWAERSVLDVQEMTIYTPKELVQIVKRMIGVFTVASGTFVGLSAVTGGPEAESSSALSLETFCCTTGQCDGGGHVRLSFLRYVLSTSCPLRVLPLQLRSQNLTSFILLCVPPYESRQIFEPSGMRTIKLPPIERLDK